MLPKNPVVVVTESSFMQPHLRLVKLRKIASLSTTEVYFFLRVTILVSMAFWSSPILNTFGAKSITS